MGMSRRGCRAGVAWAALMCASPQALFAQSVRGEGDGSETGAPVAARDGAAAAVSASDLARALAEAGVALPAGFVVNGDGTVSLPHRVVDATAAPADGGVARDGPAAVELAAIESGAIASGVAASDSGESNAGITEASRAEWDNKIDLSASLTDGNSEQTAFRLGYTGRRKTDSSLLKLNASYAYTTSDGAARVNRATGQVNHDWRDDASRWFGFAGGRGDYDQFRSFRYRVNVNGGLGFKALRGERLKLTLRVGGGATREFGSDNDEVVPEGLVGADVAWQITENQSVESTLRFYPDIAEIENYRFVGTAEWRLDLEEVDDGLGFVAGLEYEQISEIDRDVSRDDVYVYAGVTWDF